MNAVTDMAISDAQGNTAVLVEAKGRTPTDKAWAVGMRRNLFAHGGPNPASYFVLVAADRTYFWMNGAADDQDRPPDVIVDTDEILRPYLERARFKAEEISEFSLELIVRSWLSELIAGQGIDRIPDPQRQALAGGRFFESIRNGHITGQRVA